MNKCLSVRVWPPGKIVGKSDGLTELLHIPNSAKVVNIKDPHPGMWSIKVNNSFLEMCVKLQASSNNSQNGGVSLI